MSGRHLIDNQPNAVREEWDDDRDGGVEKEAPTVDAEHWDELMGPLKEARKKRERKLEYLQRNRELKRKRKESDDAAGDIRASAKISKTDSGSTLSRGRKSGSPIVHENMPTATAEESTPSTQQPSSSAAATQDLGTPDTRQMARHSKDEDVVLQAKKGVSSTDDEPVAESQQLSLRQMMGRFAQKWRSGYTHEMDAV